MPTDVLSNGLIAARWRMAATAFALAAPAAGIAFGLGGGSGSPRQPARNSVPTRVAAPAADAPGGTSRRPPARSCPRTAGDDPIPWRRFRKPRLRYPVGKRWSRATRPGSSAFGMRHRDGSSATSATPRSISGSGRSPRREDASNDDLPQPAPDLGRRHGGAKKSSHERTERRPGFLVWDHALGFSPDGRTLATARNDTEDNASQRRIRPEKGSAGSGRFSTDGSILAGATVGVPAYRGDFSLADVRLCLTYTRPDRRPAGSRTGSPTELDESPDRVLRG